MTIRRVLLVIAVALATLVLVAAYGWFVAVPAHRPVLSAEERFGVDVSNHQGSIDWTRIAADDISFAYIKATEGGDFVDTRFAENWREAGRVGIERGAYHFFTLCTPGTDQARNFLATVPADTTAMAPAVDLEPAGNCSRRPSAAQVRAELDTFLTIVEAQTGQTVVLYLGDDFEAEYHVRDDLDRPLWLVGFLRRPGDDWHIWQVQGFAHVDGINGRADLDVMR